MTCIDGRFVGIEVKVIDKCTDRLGYTEVQLVRLRALRDSGGLAVGAAYCVAVKRWALDFDLDGIAETDWVLLPAMVEQLEQKAIA